MAVNPLEPGSGFSLAQRARLVQARIAPLLGAEFEFRVTAEQATDAARSFYTLVGIEPLDLAQDASSFPFRFFMNVLATAGRRKWPGDLTLEQKLQAVLRGELSFPDAHLTLAALEGLSAPYALGPTIPLDLSGLRIYGADLTNADLHNAFAQGVSWSHVALAGANLSGADLRDGSFSYDDGSDGGRGRRSRRRKAGEDPFKRGFQGTTMEGADLRGASFYVLGRLGDAVSEPGTKVIPKLKLAGLNLRDAQLQGANLENTDIADVDLTGAYVDGRTQIDASGLSAAGFAIRGGLIVRAEVVRSGSGSGGGSGGSESEGGGERPRMDWDVERGQLVPVDRQVVAGEMDRKGPDSRLPAPIVPSSGGADTHLPAARSEGPAQTGGGGLRQTSDMRLPVPRAIGIGAMPGNMMVAGGAMLLPAPFGITAL